MNIKLIFIFFIIFDVILNITHDSNYELDSYLDLNNKQAMEQVYKKIKHYESIEREPVRHLNPNEMDENNLPTNKLRSLGEMNIFEDVTLFNLEYYFLFNFANWFYHSMNDQEWRVLVYPYSFDYQFQNEKNITDKKHYTQGVFISLKRSDLDGLPAITLVTKGVFQAKRARVIYGEDIAILSIEAIISNYNQDLFQDSVDWCTHFYKNFYRSGMCLPNYEQFYKEKVKDPKKKYVTRLNETDIKNGSLLFEKIPRFGLLIIPDYKLGTDEIIKSKLGKDGMNNILNFYNAGGKIVITGKSGALFEDIGIIAKGTYNKNRILNVETSNRQIGIKGCNETYNKVYNEKDDDFVKQLICTRSLFKKKVSLSTTFKTVKEDKSFETLIEVDSEDPNLVTVDIEDGLSYSLTDEEKKYNPLFLHKSNKNNGHIYVLNCNPFFKGSDTTIAFNLIWVVFSRELHLVSKINMNNNSTLAEQLPIPAGEAGVELGIETLFRNLDDHKLTNAKFYFFLADNFNFRNILPNCVKKNDLKSLPDNIINTKLIESNTYLECNIGEIEPFNKSYINTQISIENYLATQTKYQVLIIQLIASFYDSKGKQNTLSENILANCEPAPVLRVEINPQPTYIFPLWGRGENIENIIKLENKEESTAYNVSFTEIIPIISPLVNSYDQRRMEYRIKLYSDYYTRHNFEVPLMTPGAEDIIYTAELQEEEVIIGAEWDSPVLPVKELYLKDEIGKPVAIKGINSGRITVNSTSEILRQINYRQTDRLYKLASQRLMVYVDDTSPEGAKTLYGNNIPEEWKDPVLNDRAKKEFVFTRNDIFFYDNENFCNPSGINERITFSIDQLVPYQKNREGCAKNRGEARSKVVKQGYFTNNSTDPEINKKILEPTIYSNEWFDHCDLDVINPLDQDEINKYFGNNTNFKPVHYIVPNIDKNISQPQQLYNFTQINERFGYHQIYNSIKFLYLHSLEFTLKNTTCLYGGRFIINLGEYDLKSIDDVTVAPDHIAVYNITYSNHEITIYFKRGLMSNEQFGKNMRNIIFIENLPIYKDISLKMTVEELKYDISYPPNYERYYSFTSDTYTFSYISAFSFPALEITSYLDRNLNKYETLEPFTKYGIYTQELGHRTFYTSGETHHQYIPGILSEDGCSYPISLGTSFIPFVEYLRTGPALLIPGVSRTSRVSWRDVWGRSWHQPIRSTFPDILPIPPIDRNFAMTTTFELLNKGRQILEWPSDENVQIHLHIKLLNNYPKYFEITRCKNNELRYIPYTLSEDEEIIHRRHYENKSDLEIKEDEYIEGSNAMFIKNGGYSKYGACYAHKDAIVGGKKIGDGYLEDVEKAKLCADEIDPAKIIQCEVELKDIPTIHKCPKDWDPNELWNYSPIVEDYYPKGYIEKDMWNMDILDYLDTPLDKAYNYHIDNLLPTYDTCNDYPENTIAIPIFKGLGYSISYNKTNKMKYHNVNKEGWWCDNLQNKDDTLIAQNEISNKISIDKKSTIEWVDGKDLIGSKRPGSNELVEELINNRTRNIYVCLYNRKRPKYNLNSKKNYQTINVVENNIVPIIVDLDKGDSRIHNYNCKEEQYTPDNIHNLDGNLLVTPTSKDYLYFAANLRGGAKEALNIVLNLNYFSKIKYEGLVKINEGGRMVYYNPVNGINNYMYVDSPVSIVTAKRNDIEIIGQIYPKKIPTFNGIVYHSFIIRDENKINKIWPHSDYFTNSYGFGDVSVSVSVGGIRKSKPILKPGGTTYAKIVFYNNCGFDWNMNVGAIDFEYVGSKPINSFEFFHRFIHSIKLPLKYNFLNYIVEDRYKPYIRIAPSPHNIDVVGEFYDLESNNVITIKDGFKGEYYLQINITKELPEELKGKPIEIKIDLNTTYFDHFPGTDSDPIKDYHKYTVQIPSIYIAVPFEKGEFIGKVLYTSAFATNLLFQFTEKLEYNLEGIKYITKETLYKIENCTGSDTEIKELNEIWNSLKDQKSLRSNESNINEETKTVNVLGLEDEFPTFPKPVLGKPDIAETILLVKASYTQNSPGWGCPIYHPRITFYDWSGKKKYKAFNEKYLEAQGAWIVISYSRKLVDKIGEHLFTDIPDQNLYPDENGYMQVQFKLENTGNAVSYKTIYKIIIQPGLEYVDHRKGINKIGEEKLSNGQTVLTFDIMTPINPSEIKGGIIYFHYTKIIDSYDLLNEEEKKKLPTELKVAQESFAIIDLTEEGYDKVTQNLKKSLVFQYKLKERQAAYLDLIISGRRSNPTVKIVPKIKYIKNTSDKDTKITYYKSDITKYNDSTNKSKLIDLENEEIDLKLEALSSDKDSPCTKENSNKEHEVIYSINAQLKDGSSLSNRYKYEQTKIGMSTTEVVLIIISIFFYIAAGTLIWFSIKNIRLNKEDNAIEKTIKETKIEQLLEE